MNEIAHKAYFKAKVVHNDPMINPENGWVTGFYYEDLCLDKEGKPVMKSFIRSGEMIWEVIPESAHQQLPIKDSSDKVLYEGDIVNVLCNDGSNGNCLVGFDTERFGWGLMTAHYYTALKQGYFKEESYNNAFLQNCLTHDTVLRIIGNIYDNEQFLIVQ